MRHAESELRQPRGGHKAPSSISTSGQKRRAHAEKFASVLLAVFATHRCPCQHKKHRGACKVCSTARGGHGEGEEARKIGVEIAAMRAGDGKFRLRQAAAAHSPLIKLFCQ